MLALINLFLILIFLFISFPAISNKFKKIGKKYWLIILIVLLLGLMIRLFLAPHHHRFFIDEAFYMGAAKNLLFYLKSTISTGIYPKQIGWPLLLTIPFFMFGVNNYIAIYTSIFFGSISIILMYFLVYLLSKNKRLALISSFLLAILPLHVIYSGTAETIVVSVFFLLVTLISFIIMIKNQKKKLIFLALFLFLFTIQIRLENILILIPMLVYIFLNKIKLNLKNWIFPIIISSPLFISYLIQIYQLTNFYDGAYYQDLIFFGFREILSKLTSIDLYFNFLFTLSFLFLIIGFIGLHKSKILIFYISWFLAYFGHYLFYLFSDDFHVIPGLVALLPIMAYGIIHISTLSSKIFPKKKLLLDTTIMIVILLSFFASFDKDIVPEYLIETKTLEKLKQDIPDDCVVVAEIPIIVTSVTELRAIDTIYFLDHTDENLLAYKDTCLIYFEDIYCKKNIILESDKRCETMHSNFKLSKYKEYNEMGITLSLYNISN